MEIVPSILSANFAHLAKDIKKVENSINYLHIDIMDGQFVENLSFGPMIVSAIRTLTDLKFECHLMVLNPEKYLIKLKEAGANVIGVHVESTAHIHRVIDAIHRLGMEAEIVLNPGTPIALIEPLLDEVESILVMTVDPGAGGQKMIKKCLKKVLTLSELRDMNDYNYRIEIDGGVNKDTIQNAQSMGVDRAVAGSYVFKSDNPSERIATLMKECQKDES